MPARITLIFSLLSLVPIASHAQSADSLHLLWRNEAISGVTAHAFSHSGKILALVNDHEIKFWDLKKGEVVRTISLPFQNYTRNFDYTQVAFTPNDSEIILLNNTRPPRLTCYVGERPAVGFELRVNVASGKAYRDKGVSEANCEWALSVDGNFIAVLADSGTLSIHRSLDCSVISSTVLPPFSAALLTSHYRGWIPPRGVWFTSGDRGLLILWNYQVWYFDPLDLGKKKFIADTVDTQNIQSLAGEGIFIPRSNAFSKVLISKTLQEAKLQPPAIRVPPSKNPVYSGGVTNQPIAAYLFGNGKFLASRYPLWRGMVFDYGTPPGEDSLIITTSEHPELTWGIRLNRFIQVLNVMSDNKLLLGNEGSFMILDAKAHTFMPLILPNSFAGFGRDGNSILTHNDRNLYSFNGHSWKLIDSASAAPSDRASDALFLKWYLRVVPAGDDKVLAYMDFWSKNDLAKIFNLRTEDSSIVFPGGLNYGIDAGAVSRDNNWVATVSAEGSGRVWRASDGALKVCFVAKGASEAQFPLNDRFLIYSSRNDSGIMILDFKTGETRRLLVDQMIISGFRLNADCSRIAVFRYRPNQWNGVGSTVTELYEIPPSWRTNDPTFDPKTVYLPLRFYLPKDAPDAFDTNGRPYNPPRTHVELELRYGNGKLLKKILEGPLHKGKWHEWVYDMTPYPKGTYSMHTEIGGVVKDEKMEVR